MEEREFNDFKSPGIRRDLCILSDEDQGTRYANKHR